MGVNLGGFAAFMPQEVLDVAKVHAFFEQVGGKGVAQGVGGRQGVGTAVFFAFPVPYKNAVVFRLDIRQSQFGHFPKP